MRIGTVLLAGTAALALAGCGSGRYAGQENGAGAYDFSSEWYTDNSRKQRFNSADDLREYLMEGLDARISSVLEFYNERFGEGIEPEGTGIDCGEFWMFSGGMPVFRYDLDSHRMVLEYVPHDNADMYARKLGRSRDAMGEYEASTFGLVPHETAHWYHDMVLVKSGCGGFSGHVMGKDRALDRMMSMIVEGTAVYMSKFLDADESYAGRPEYAGAIDSLMDGKPIPVWAYPAGEELVTPILDKDFGNGIRLMSGSFPDIRTAGDVRTYQKEILERLDSIGSPACP